VTAAMPGAWEERIGAFAAAMAVSNQVTAEKWVAIPPELLQLAGIAIASGVFSSLIANVSGEQQQPIVTGLDPAGGNQVVVRGGNFGTASGALRVNGKTLAVFSWTDDAITAAAPILGSSSPKGPWPLVIDTANGKVCYPLTTADSPLAVGPPRIWPE
jgi:hypothetical protein